MCTDPSNSRRTKLLTILLIQLVHPRSSGVEVDLFWCSGNFMGMSFTDHGVFPLLQLHTLVDGGHHGGTAKLCPNHAITMPQSPVSWLVTFTVLPSLRPQYFIFLLHKLKTKT